MKRIIALVLASLACLVLFAACDKKDPTPTVENTTDSAASIQPKEKLIVGLDDTFAPMGFRNEKDELVGFDVDLANSVGELIDMEIVFQPINWDAKEMELDSKRIDCIWNGMSSTPEREEAMLLSQPYLNNKIIIMTYGVVIENLTQLKDVKIGTQQKSAALATLEALENYDELKSNITEYATYDECILDMQAGRIQAMVVDEVLGMYKNSKLEEKFDVSPVDFGEDLYVIGFRKEDTELCKKIEGAIIELYNNGGAETISDKWFGEHLVLEMTK